MKLYHGTTEAVALAALTEGLKPRTATRARSRWTDAPSHADAVYLTDAYPLYFGLHAAGTDGKPAVVEVDTDLLRRPELLVPDEDALEQTGRKFDGLDPKWSMHKRTAHYRKQLRTHIGAKTEAGLGTWQASLKALGTCAYLGTISPAAITRVAVIYEPEKQQQLCWMAADAMIMVMNYQLCAPKYRAITAHLFGDTPEPDMLFHIHTQLAQMPRDGITVFDSSLNRRSTR